YDVSSPHEIIAAHLRDTPIKLSSILQDVDPEFEALLESCLAKDATARPTADDVARRLVRGASVLLEWPPPGLEALHGRPGRVIALLGAGAVGLGAPLVLLASTSRTSAWRMLLPSPVFVASAAAIGALLTVAGGVRLIQLARRARIAARAGH